MLLLNRLQSKPSTSFTQAFVYFVTLLSAVESVGPDFVIQSLDAIQAGYVQTRKLADNQVVWKHLDWSCSVKHAEGVCQGPKGRRGRFDKTPG
jgi:hypothetical protein